MSKVLKFPDKPEEVHLYEPPPIAGQYEIGKDSGFAIHIRTKPSAWTRFWMRTLLDWRWTDGSI